MRLKITSKLGLIAISSFVFLSLSLMISSASAQPQQIFPTGESARSSKFFSAAIAFALGALSAGWAVGRAGSAGMAAVAERPELRTQAIIITALGEALAIYGIVIAILILGAEV